jgi:hypothetical protein
MRRVFGVLAVCWMMLGGHAALAQPRTAQQMVERAELAIGAAAFNGPARYAHAVITGQAWLLEQSGDLDGGWLRLSLGGEADVDLAEARANITQTQTMPAMDNAPWSQWHLRVSSTGAARAPTDPSAQWRGAPPQLARAARRYLDLFPSLLLLSAKQASDLEATSPSSLRFTRGDQRVSLHFGAQGALESFEIEASFPDDMMLAPWGRTTIRGAYGFWWRDASGAVLPRQLNLTHNGRPWMMFELSSFSLSATPPESLRERHDDTTATATPVDAFPFSTRHEEIAPGVRIYYGAWNIVVVEQQDGLVVLDAPISPGYSRALLRQLEQDFPGQRVKALVSTSWAWPHLGGIAEYAQRRVPAYVAPSNQRLARLFSEAADVRRFDMRDARDGAVIGRGRNAIVLRHAPGPELDGMVFVSIGDAGLIWASDALQLEGAAIAPHARQYAAELLQSVCADLRPDTRLVAMHAGPLPASALIAQFAAEATPPCATH